MSVVIIWLAGEPRAAPRSPCQPMTGFIYTFAWDLGLGRKGQRCAVFARGRSMNSVGVQFEDGFRMVTSGNSLRRVKEQPIL